ncbi:hypothetical protein DFH07DRAFT_770599 [Mycena maculata]|uniref:Uncharacterized protein n=1 Tax=Mycena maculata TaxID=230809 RepID=A0AAD7JG39_9AGAR|nr:hypothetical protein DFH07DRAFT_770599 [Mycena maculata]
MAPIKTADLFRGNGTSEKAHMWLRTLEGAWKYDADDKEKLYRFKKGLHPGGQAEEWWNGLAATEKQTWPALMVAFETKWAKPKPTRWAQDVVIAELMDNCLARSALGKYVEDEDGISILSHVAWAEVVQKLLAELVGGDASMMLKSGVCAMLPVEFRQLINDTGLDTWEKYLKAVEDVGVDRIADAVEDCTAHQDRGTNELLAWHAANPNATPAQSAAFFETFASRMAVEFGLGHLLLSPGRSAAPSPPRYIPPAARQSQPTPGQSHPAMITPGPRGYPATPSTMVDPRTPWAQRPSPDVFGGSTARPYPNAFTKNLMTTPISPSAGRCATSLSGDPARDAMVAQQVAQSPGTYATDTAGIQRYTADMAPWMSQNGNSPSPDYTTFPLSPRTVAAGSRECFRCGILTSPPHFGQRACVSQNGHEVPQREQNLRNAVGALLRPPGQRTPARVSQINESPYDLFGGYNVDQPLYEDYPTSLPAVILSLDAVDQETIAPFYQRAQLLGPNGAVVHVTAQVDNGAMRNCMSLTRWKQYGHCLSQLVPSKTRLGVANGGKVWPYGQWWGEVSVGGVRAAAWFEVFECSGTFDVILGKPWLHSVRAIHNYETDEIRIRSKTEDAVLQNEEAPATPRKEASDLGEEAIAGVEADEVLGDEERWLVAELDHITRKQEKERARKAAQLERRPKPREPRPFPVKELTPAREPGIGPPNDAAAPNGTPVRSRELEKENQLFEEEYRRIGLIQAHAPWAETQFAKYLAIDPIADADPELEDSGDASQEYATLEAAETLDWHQQAKRLRQAANRLWNDTLAAAQHANAKSGLTVAPEMVTASDLRRERDRADRAKWALHRQVKALGNIFQINTRSVGSEEQLQSLVTSEVRIKRLRNKLDEMRAMVDECGGSADREPDSDVNVIGDTCQMAGYHQYLPPRVY